ncbi:MAG: radical SAM protein [Bacteroidales bacterium]|nr:radical SAM protein [Bacteroidales bacterium]
MRALNWIKYLTFTKLKNLIKLYFYFKRNKNLDLVLPHPSFISFEPTNFCNLKCPACPSGTGKLTRPKGYADLNLFKKIIDENKKYLINLILHFQGEPLLHKELGEMIKYANKNNIRTEFSTNAQVLSQNIKTIIDAKPDKIIISLDGLTQDTYNKYRINGDINKGFKSLEVLSSIPKKLRPLIELQFLVFKHNEKEIKELKQLKKKYKIDRIVLKTAQIYGKEQLDLLPSNPRYSRYKNGSDGTPILKNTIRNRCNRIVFGSVITWDGKLVPCCFDKDAKHIMGDLTVSTLNEIRNEKAYKRFVKNVFSQRNKIEMCKNCTEA